MFSFVGLGPLLGIAVTPILAELVLAEAGGGHGTYLLAKLFLPCTMASTTLTDYISQPFVVLGLAQFPACGLFIDWARSTGRARQCALKLSGLHAAFVALAFSASDFRSFTP